MNYDFHAHFRIDLNDSYLVGKCTRGQEPYASLSTDTRVRILAQALAGSPKTKATAQSGERPDRPSGLKAIILGRNTAKYDVLLKERFDLLTTLGLVVPQFSLQNLPPGTWAIQFPFKLAKPYVSKDDTSFYIIDNPIKKEKVLSLPYVSASSWKGTFRSAFRDMLGGNDYHPKLVSLFGNSRTAEKDFCAGSLMFYPTFFSQIGLEVINPHSRHAGSGTLPIYLEVVPAGATGTFTLLNARAYHPEWDIQRTNRNTVQSLRNISLVIEYVFLELGFGAKTSSGFGIVEDHLPENGQVILSLAKDNPLEPFTLQDKFCSITKLYNTVTRITEKEISRRR